MSFVTKKDTISHLVIECAKLAQRKVEETSRRFSEKLFAASGRVFWFERARKWHSFWSTFPILDLIDLD